MLYTYKEFYLVLKCKKKSLLNETQQCHLHTHTHTHTRMGGRREAEFCGGLQQQSGRNSFCDVSFDPDGTQPLARGESLKKFMSGLLGIGHNRLSCMPQGPGRV